MPAKPKRRHPVWRFFGILLLVVIVIVVLAVVAVQIVLGTEVPRELIVRGVEKELGLRFAVGKVSVGWWGQTTLSDATISLPLAQQAFLEAPKLTVNHSFLPWLLLTQSLEITSLNLDKPKLVVVQDATGRWNLQEVATLMARAAGSQQAQKQEKKGAPKLPDLEVTGATLQITDNQGRSSTIQPVHISGRNRGPLAWGFEVKAPPQLSMDGELAVGGNWQHRVKLSLTQLGPWAQPWIKDWPEPAYVTDLNWQGRLGSDGQLVGRADIGKLQVQEYAAQGVVNVQSQGGAITISPKGMTIQTPQPLLSKAIVREGKVRVEGWQVKGEDLLVSAAGGMVRLNGQWNAAARDAGLDLTWEQVELPGAITSEGSLKAKLSEPWPGRQLIGATVQTKGKGTYGEWDTKAELAGQGESWQNLDWTLRVPQLAFQREGSGPGQTVTANDLVAHLTTRGPVISLTDLNFTGAGQITGRGAVDLQKKLWWLWVDAENLPVPGPGGETAAMVVDVWGDPDLVTLKQFYLRGGEADLTAKGWYSAKWPKPIQISVYMSHPPIGTVPPEQDLPLRGKFISSAYVSGTVMPLELDVAGEFSGREMSVMRRPVGDVSAQLKGQITKEHAWIGTKLKLFEGDWDVLATYPVWNRKLNSQTVQVKASVQDLSLQAVGDLMKRKEPKASPDQKDQKDQNEPTVVDGQLSGEWTIEVARPQVDRLTVIGSLTAKEVRIGDFGAELVKAHTVVEDGVLTLDPISLQQSETQGRADATLALGCGSRGTCV